MADSFTDIWNKMRAQKQPSPLLTSPTPAVDSTVIMTASAATILDQSFSSGDELTIATGIIAPTAICHAVDTEADAATDNLAGAYGCAEGKPLIIFPASASRNWTLKHNDTTEGLDGTRFFLSDGADRAPVDLYDAVFFIGRMALDSGLGGWLEVPGIGPALAAHIAAADPHTGYVLESLFDALGDVLYGSADNTPAKLAGNITSTRKFFRQVGDGAVSAAPAWDTLLAADVPDLSATYAIAAKGVTNGDSHDHVGGDGAQIDHGGLGGLADDDHTQYVLKTLFAAQSILAAVADDTPAAVTVAEQRLVGRITGGNIDDLTAAQVLVLLALDADPALRRFPIHINGGGAEIADGIAIEIPDMPACTVEGWTLVGSPSGSLVLDLWSDSYANHPPTVDDTMIATGTKPVISASTKGQDLTVDWADVTIAAGATLTVNVDSAATITFATLTLRLRMS